MTNTLEYKVIHPQSNSIPVIQSFLWLFDDQPISNEEKETARGMASFNT